MPINCIFSSTDTVGKRLHHCPQRARHCSIALKRVRYRSSCSSCSATQVPQGIQEEAENEKAISVMAGLTNLKQKTKPNLITKKAQENIIHQRDKQSKSCNKNMLMQYLKEWYKVLH